MTESTVQAPQGNPAHPADPAHPAHPANVGAERPAAAIRTEDLQKTYTTSRGDVQAVRPGDSIVASDSRVTLVQYVRDRHGRLRYRRVIILAEQRRDGGRDLALRDGSGVRALAQG